MSNCFVGAQIANELNLGERMRALPSIVVGVVIFAIWLSVVGNPHVVETVIGLVLGIAGAIYFHLQLLPKIWPNR